MTARAAVTVVFGINGLLYGAWAARLAAVGDRLALSAGQIGIALGFIAAGSLVAMPLAGRAASRFGSRPATRVAILAFCLASALAPAAPGLVALCAACLLLGAAAGSLDVVMNVHGVTVERAAGRPILSSFHAAFSLGGLVGALLGAAGAAAGIDVRVELAALSAAAALTAVAVTRALLPAAADAGGRPDPRAVRARRLDRRLAVLGALAFCCLLCEGAAADWSAVYLDRDLAATAAVAGLAYAAFSVAMVAGRLAGDRLTLRYGPSALVRRGALLATAGLGAALVAGDPVAALIGFACLGAGLSIVVPQVFRAAAAGRDSGLALARVSTIGYLGFLAGPPLIGALAELTSLPAALTVLPVLGLAMAALAPLTRAPVGAPA
jgi:predicted MFS family arabinose efflux permease